MNTQTRRKWIWGATFALVSMMAAWPPWSFVAQRISSAGYGPVLLGPYTDENHFGVMSISKRPCRIDFERLIVQVVAVVALAGLLDMIVIDRTPMFPNG